ncbi:MAG TPA: hypothetical protein VGJ43_14065, partial [Acidimicrobiales bacterium]
MSRVVRVDRGRYHDSVTVMRASAAGRAVDGVELVIAAMATELNRGLLVESGFDPGDASADDLVVAVLAGTDGAVGDAAAAVERVLAERRVGTAGDGPAPPRTVEAAAGRHP